MLASPAKARGQQLQAKAALRPSNFMLGLMPAGTGDLADSPYREDYEEGDAGLEAWCKAVDESGIPRSCVVS